MLFQTNYNERSHWTHNDTSLSTVNYNKTFYEISLKMAIYFNDTGDYIITDGKWITDSHVDTFVIRLDTFVFVFP